MPEAGRSVLSTNYGPGAERPPKRPDRVTNGEKTFPTAPATGSEATVDSLIDRALAEMQFNADGLIPCIAQQHDSGEVLMMAWMNAEAVRETLATRRVCYWSRSRRSLWRKGETSGNVQRLIDFRYDCDGDTILLLVEQTGPACHTNRPNCFYRAVRPEGIATLSEPVRKSA
ncbi:MAG: phosphoribosyl-AMP cyclohydrolase [Rhodospirillaceae bacterium]|nr:phosphoribosyl-AMP cyclohydrolase [Rhodospirillaceae bacterium]MYB12629.1 phosphoribosyl-AMP cyclohydrolase [Rhodospirillaceae bacterium]MYI50444.1 phosphoribosyl-AMP cyclohydrolase [Rhodospirillaceae bacterium]